MITWKTLEEEYDTAIALSKLVLKYLIGVPRMEVLENLICLYLKTGQIKKAQKFLSECRKSYGFDEAGIQVIEENFSDYNHITVAK